MKEKIIALLTAKFSGVRKDGLTQLARSMALQATTEEDAKELVEKLTKAQVDEFVKEFRADVDKEVSESNKSFETNLKKKFDFVDKNTAPIDEGKTSGNDPDDIASLINAAVADAVKPFQTELATYKANDVAKARLQSLNDKLNTCKDDNFKTKALKDFARMKFDTEDEFNEYLTDTEKDIATANQNVANTTLGRHDRPWMGSGSTDNKEATKDEIDAVLDKLPI